MRTKSLILSLGVLALGMAVSCEDKETLDPAVKIINGATAEISDEGGGTHSDLHFSNCLGTSRR